jgi:hypothetical protein
MAPRMQNQTQEQKDIERRRKERTQQQMDKAFGGQNFGDWVRGIPGRIMRQDFGRENEPIASPSRTPKSYGTMRGAWSPAGPGEISSAEILRDLGLDGEPNAPIAYDPNTALFDLFRQFSFGGGGGSSAEEQAKLQRQKMIQRNLNRYARTVADQITSGDYRTAQDDLLSQLDASYRDARPVIDTAIENLRATISGQANPYANVNVTPTEVQPQLQQLLESQGASTDPLAQYAATLQAQRQGQSEAYNNMMRQLAAGYEAGRGGQLGSAEAQRASLLAALEGARAGYGAQVNSQAAQRRGQLDELLMRAIAEGARLPKSLRG